MLEVLITNLFILLKEAMFISKMKLTNIQLLPITTPQLITYQIQNQSIINTSMTHQQQLFIKMTMPMIIKFIMIQVLNIIISSKMTTHTLNKTLTGMINSNMILM